MMTDLKDLRLDVASRMERESAGGWTQRTRKMVFPRSPGQKKAAGDRKRWTGDRMRWKRDKSLPGNRIHVPAPGGELLI